MYLETAPDDNEEENYYRAVNLLSDKDKQPWQLTRIHVMDHKDGANYPTFALSTKFPDAESFSAMQVTILMVLLTRHGGKYPCVPLSNSKLHG